jgi:hypothetical protein
LDTLRDGRGEIVDTRDRETIMTSCYLPMLEKLRLNTTTTTNNHQPGGKWVEMTEVTKIESKLGVTRQLRSGRNRVTRDSRGFTLAQGVGEFPNDVVLSIRHDHPTLSFSDLKYHRDHQTHSMGADEPFQRLNVVRDEREPPSGNRGVLTLGLPRMFTKKKAMKKSKLPSPYIDPMNLPPRRPASAHGDFVDYHQSGACPPFKMHPFYVAFSGSSPGRFRMIFVFLNEEVFVSIRGSLFKVRARPHCQILCFSFAI